MGSRPRIIVADLDALKQILIKDVNNFTSRLLRIKLQQHQQNSTPPSEQLGRWAELEKKSADNIFSFFKNIY
jgi:hypothetical protein